MPNKYAFEDYVTRTNAAQDKETLFKVYADTVAQHGLDRVLLCLATDHKDIGESQGIGVIHNYPKGWMDYYFSEKLDEIDPVMIYGLDKLESYTWEEIPKKMVLLKKQKECLDMGTDAGLNNGICVPLRGPQNSLAGLSLASSEKIDAFDGSMDLVTAYSNHFYIAFRRLGLGQSQKEVPNYVLSDKEKEILKWVSRGKSDHDIAAIMNLATHTIDWHMRNIFKKFDTNSRVIVVVKALTYGLLKL